MVSKDKLESSKEGRSSQWQLSDLKSDVRKGLLKKSLEEMKVGVEVQKEFVEEDNKQVQAMVLQSSLKDGLEKKEVRDKFFGDVEQRLTVLLVLLIKSGQVKDVDFTGENSTATLANLLQKKAQLKIKIPEGVSRDLSAQEQSILDFTVTLPNHSNKDVQAGWNAVLAELQENIKAVDFATDIISSTQKGEVPKQPGGLTKKEQGYWDQIQEKWGEVPDGVKKTALVLAGAGVGLYLLNKLFSSASSGVSTFGKILGVGALIAGGVYVAGKYMSFNNALETLKTSFSNLNPKDLALGLQAYTAGKYDIAKKYWGGHYDAMVERMTGNKSKKDGEKGEGVDEAIDSDEVPVGEALVKYLSDVKTMADPLVEHVRRNENLYAIAAIANPVLAGRLTLGALRTGKDIIVTLLKILSAGARFAARHYILSGLLISAYFMKRAAEGNLGKPYTLPKDINALKKKIQSEVPQIQEFAKADHGVDLKLDAQQIDKASDVISGKKTLGDAYDINPESLKDQVVESISEAIRLDDPEKLQKNNVLGLSEFSAALRGFNEGKKYDEFMKYLKQLQDDVKVAFTPEQLAALKTEAQKVGISVFTENQDGYIWWKRDDHPEEVYACGVDPALPVDAQFEAAKRFDPNPASVESNFKNALSYPVDDLREGVAQIVEKVSKGEASFIVGGIGTLLWDGAMGKYIKLPWNFAARVVKALSGEKFQTKEYLMDCGGAMVPIALWGTAQAIVTGGGVNKAMIIAETVAFPVTGPLKLGVTFGKRFVVPFGNGLWKGGLKQPWQAFAEVYRANLDDLSRGVRRIRYNVSGGIPLFNQLPRELQEGFKKIISYEDAIDELSKLKFSHGNILRRTAFTEDIIKNARDILTRGGMSVEDAAKLVPDEAGRDLKKVLNSLGESIESAKSLLRSSKEVSALAKPTGEAIGRASFLDDAADVGKRANFMDEVVEGSRAASWLDDSTDAGKAAKLFGEPLDSTAQGVRAASEAAEVLPPAALISTVEKVQDLTKATRELEVIENLLKAKRPLKLQQMNTLAKAAKTEALMGKVTAIFGTLSDDVSRPLLEALKNSKNIGVLSDAFKVAGVPLSKGVRALSVISKFAPGTAVAGLAAFGSFYQARQTYLITQAYKENEDIRELMTGKSTIEAGIGGMELVIDIVSIGFKGSAWVAIPLTVFLETMKYMATSAIDAATEISMEAKEYLGILQQKGREELLHMWFTTGEDLGAGEAYAKTVGIGSTQLFLDERTDTKEKIIDALLLADSPDQTPGGPHETYRNYRKKYIQLMGDGKFSVTTFREAEELLARSEVFAGAMLDRKNAKALYTRVQPNSLYPEGKKPVNITPSESDKYEFRKLTAETIFEVESALRNQSRDYIVNMLSPENENSGKALYARFEQLDVNFLRSTVNMIEGYLEVAREDEGKNLPSSEKWLNLQMAIMTYLKMSGHLVTLEAREVEEEVLRENEKLFFDVNLTSQSLIEHQAHYIPKSPGLSAIYELAKFYGYTGMPIHELMKQFFVESKAGIFGIYWNGDQWKINDKNGLDEDAGSEPDVAAQIIIKEFGDDPGDILQSRYDSLFQKESKWLESSGTGGRDDYNKRLVQIKNVHDIMNNAYNNYRPLSSLTVES